MKGEVTIRIAADSFPIGKSMDDFQIPHIFNSEKAREDLQEYLGDFLSDIGGDLSIRLYPFNDRMTVYLTMLDGDYRIKMDQGFSFDLPFNVIDKWDVPRFGNYIFGMWNAYIMAFVDDNKPTRPWPYFGEYIIPEEEDKKDDPVIFRSDPWIVPEEEEDEA